jgi:hypothetical protein
MATHQAFSTDTEQDLSYAHEDSAWVPRQPGPDEPANQAPSVEQILGPPADASTPPVLESLAPSSIVAGAGPTPVTVTGTGFVPASTVWADEEAQVTTYVSDTELDYDAQADQAGTQTITVRDAGTSNAIELTVT